MPRKTYRGNLRGRIDGRASMRPRPDAAENTRFVFSDELKVQPLQ